MTKEGERRRGSARGETANTGPIENPLDFIAEDHMREREVCALIDRLVATFSIESAEREMMLKFLKYQLPQHLADEEIDLFPLMRARCKPEEDIKSVIDKLEADHAHAIADAPAIVALIKAKKSRAAAFSQIACAQLTEFATQARRHLIVENAIILPIARARLTKNDLETMRSHMLKRRGLEGLRERETC